MADFILMISSVFPSLCHPLTFQQILWIQMIPMISWRIGTNQSEDLFKFSSLNQPISERHLTKMADFLVWWGKVAWFVFKKVPSRPRSCQWSKANPRKVTKLSHIVIEARWYIISCLWSSELSSQNMQILQKLSEKCQIFTVLRIRPKGQRPNSKPFTW